MQQSDNRSRFLQLCAALILGCLLAYGFLAACDFVNYDDPKYVTDNPHLKHGLSLPGLAWAFTTNHASNWHPLTWLSHMLDCQLYGLSPAGHHLTNLLFHIANTLLLFRVLFRMTGALWRSACVAALFAWHPLHVESVAWISERKDVLSAFFWLLALNCFASYAQPSALCVPQSKIQNPKSKISYLLTLFCFLLGLLSKPMVVTFPFVLLLLDYWPLQRFANKSSKRDDRNSPAPSKPTVTTPLPLPEERAGVRASVISHTQFRLWLEIIPFVLLSAASSLITILVQRSGGAMATLQRIPFLQRLANALVAYATYLRKTIWPVDLAVIYPLPPSIPVWQIVAAALLLLALTLAAVAWRRSRPWFLVGWFWFLGTLVPVIGLVQVGQQSMADRYTYLPLMGIFIILVWGVAEITEHFPRLHPSFLPSATAAVLLACLSLTFVQTLTWRDSTTLFTRALAVTPRNLVAHDNLGVALNAIGRTNEALAQYNAALEIAPDEPYTLYHKALLLADQHQIEPAIQLLQASIRSKPNIAAAHYHLARLLAAQSRPNEAIAEYNESLRWEPDSADAHYNLANALASQGQFAEAVDHYRESLRWDPDSSDARNNLAAILVRLRQFSEAQIQLQRIVDREPTNAPACYNLAGVFAAQKQWDHAITAYERAADLTRRQNPAILAALDQAYAQAGRFDEALQTAQTVQQLATKLNLPALTEAAARRIDSYHAHKP